MPVTNVLGKAALKRVGDQAGPLGSRLATATPSMLGSVGGAALLFRQGQRQKGGVIDRLGSRMEGRTGIGGGLGTGTPAAPGSATAGFSSAAPAISQIGSRIGGLLHQRPEAQDQLQRLLGPDFEAKLQQLQDLLGEGLF